MINWLDRIKELYSVYNSYSKIADILGTSRQAVTYWIRKKKTSKLQLSNSQKQKIRYHLDKPILKSKVNGKSYYEINIFKNNYIKKLNKIILLHLGDYFIGSMFFIYVSSGNSFVATTKRYLCEIGSVDIFFDECFRILDRYNIYGYNSETLGSSSVMFDGIVRITILDLKE